MKMCWNLEPTERPTFSKITQIIQRFLGDPQEPNQVRAEIRSGFRRDRMTQRPRGATPLVGPWGEMYSGSSQQNVHPENKQNPVFFLLSLRAYRTIKIHLGVTELPLSGTVEVISQTWTLEQKVNRANRNVPLQRRPCTRTWRRPLWLNRTATWRGPRPAPAPVTSLVTTRKRPSL